MEQLIENKDYVIHEDGTLEIFEGVRYIPAGTFKYLKNITNLVLPSTLILIGVLAFSECNLLSGTLILPDSVKYVLDGAFSGCNFSKVVLGKDLMFIGEEAFNRNSIEEIINNSDSLKLVNKYAFTGNDKLNKLTINNKYAYIINTQHKDVRRPRNNYVIGEIENTRKLYIYCEDIDEEESFDEDYICNYKTKDNYTFYDGVLTIKDGVEIIGDFSKLEGCTDVIMPDSVIAILPGAFSSLEKLKRVRFSNNLLAVMSEAFYGCSLNKSIIRMPNSLCMLSVDSFRRNIGNNVVIIPPTTYTFGFHDKSDYPFELANSFDDGFQSKIKYIFNVNDLVEEEKNYLKSLGLLPEIINENKLINNNVTKYQSNTMKKAFTDILMNNDYDEEKNMELIKKLLESKAFYLTDIDDIVDHLFIKRQISTIYLLMSYGYNYLDNCMIGKAILNDMVSMIDVLLILGTDINETGSLNMTPLSIACKKGNVSLAKYLIEKSAAINMVDMNNKKAIDYALENNNQEIINLLSNYSKNEERTPEEDMQALKLLLDN